MAGLLQTIAGGCCECLYWPLSLLSYRFRWKQSEGRMRRDAETMDGAGLGGMRGLYMRSDIWRSLLLVMGADVSD
jgi:hypothetical protein